MLGLAALVFAAYAIILRFPFIQDDWGWISRFQSNHPDEILKSIFAIKGTIFFRPLAGLYLYVMYLVFGAHPLPFHLVALIILIANSWLVTAIMRVITRDMVISYASGFVYAMGASVHLECLLWAVGIHDLGGSFFFLLSMLLFLKERPAWSVAAFCVGCLFKETVLVLPFIVAGYLLIMGQRLDASSRTKAFNGFVAMVIAFCALVGIKLAGMSPFNLAPSHPYVIRLLGRHILSGLFSYMTWMVQCFDPFLAIQGTTIKYVLNDLLLVSLFSVWLAAREDGEEQRATGAKPLLFLLVWLCVALAPVIFLPNHSYRYYAMYALPAFIGIVLLQVRLLSGSVRVGRRAGRALVVCVAAGAVILSLLQSHKMLHEGRGQRTLADGTNGLIRKAASVEIVHDSLMKRLPTLPRDATILLGDAEMGSFDKDSGFRVWYGDQSINVYSLNDFVCDETGSYVLVPIENEARGIGGASLKKIYLDPDKIYVFRVDETGLRPVNLDNMLKRAAPPAR